MEVQYQYEFDQETNELKTGGSVPACLPGGIGILLFEKLKTNAKQGFIAQIEAETGYEDSYVELLERCKKLATYMTKSGIKPGDIVLSCSPNNLNNMVVFVSCIFIGAIHSALDPLSTLKSAIYVIKMTQPKLIFISQDSLQTIEEANSCVCNTKLVVFESNEQHENLPQIYASLTANDITNFQPYFVEDTTKTLCMVQSSGTTGSPKAICLNHNFWFANLAENNNICHIPSQSIFFTYTNPYWSSAIQGFFMNLFCGWKRFVCAKFDPSIFWSLIDKYKIQLTLLSYFQALEVYEYLNLENTNILFFVIAGGQLSLEIQQNFGKLLPRAKFFSPYSVTEIGGISVNNDFNNPSCGKVIHKNQVIKIVDTETQEPLPIGKTGEIRIKSKYQMNGYYKSESNNYWDSDGFFKTADLGYLNDKFELFIVGRVSQTFKYRNYFVVPSIIERHLESHEAVHQCVVIDVPLPSLPGPDNHPMAVVVLKNNVSITSDELLQYSNQKMDHVHQLRAGVKIVSKKDIPYSRTGKVHRAQLKENILKIKHI